MSAQNGCWTVFPSCTRAIIFSNIGSSLIVHQSAEPRNREICSILEQRNFSKKCLMPNRHARLMNCMTNSREFGSSVIGCELTICNCNNLLFCLNAILHIFEEQPVRRNAPVSRTKPPAKLRYGHTQPQRKDAHSASLGKSVAVEAKWHFMHR